MKLGRPVTFDDLIAAHAKNGHCPHCLGSARIRKHHPANEYGPARISVNYCYKALQDLQAEGVHRIAEHPITHEAHWIAGCDPDQWSFTQMWLAEDWYIGWRRAFSFVTRRKWRREARA